MPKFSDNTGEKRNAALAKAQKQFLITEEKCHACQSPHRALIDKLLMLGTKYSEIARMADISPSSIGNHAREHLNVEDAAVVKIAEDQARQLNQNIEEGVSGLLARRVYLEVATQKGLKDLLSGAVKVAPRDMANLIELGEKLDDKISGATREEIMRQFQAFVTAIQEVCSEEVFGQISLKTKEILREQEIKGELNP